MMIRRQRTAAPPHLPPSPTPYQGGNPRKPARNPSQPQTRSSRNFHAITASPRHPGLVLVAPSLRVVGIQSDLGVEEVLARRAHEPWYSSAAAALSAEATSPQELERYRWLAAPLLYGQWNAAAQAAAEP